MAGRGTSTPGGRSSSVLPPLKKLLTILSGFTSRTNLVVSSPPDQFVRNHGRNTMTASIVGWAHTPFGKFDTETVESLVVRVATDALADAGISAGDVVEIGLGRFDAGF